MPNQPSRRLLPGRTRTAALAVVALLAQLLVVGVATTPAAAADAVLSGVDITAPNLVGDSNVLAQPTQGPDSFFITAEFCNTATTHDLNDVEVYIGDGTTPGTFPLNSPPPGTTAYTSSHALQMVSGTGNDEVRWIGTLPAGGVHGTDDPKCQTEHWIVQYDAVGTDAGGNPAPLWGQSNTIADDFVYDYTFWGRGVDAGDGSPVTFASVGEKATVRNEITAAPNKIQPTGNPAGFTIITDDPTPQVGEEVIVRFNNVTFGNPNQGFDDDGDGLPDYDLWFQPIGEAGLWDADVFRLVRVEATITGTQCGAGRPNVTLFKVDDTYFRDLDQYGGCKWDGNYEYRFVGLQPGASRLAPYQEVASGSDNEKYNNDYCGDTAPTATDPAWDPLEDICVLLTVLPNTALDLDKTVDQAYVDDEDVLTWDVAYQNTGDTPAGTSLAKVWIEDSIPANTSYVAGSASCTVPYAVTSPACEINWSTTNGIGYSATEPADPTTVTDVRWILNDPVPAGDPSGSACSTVALAPTGACSVSFQTTVDAGFKGTVVNIAQISIEGGPPLDQDNAQSCSVCFDNGDAPDSYGTVVGSSGPRHLRTGAAADIRLGATVDTERNGLPAAAGGTTNGDDTDDADDEDGVSIPNLDGNTNQVVTFSVTDAAGGTSFVNGWIDLDGNGTFDTGESIFSSGVFVSANAVSGSITPGASGAPAAVTAGSYEVTVSVPDLAAAGFTSSDVVYSRFRLSSAESEVTGPTGNATSGEVEDYGTPISTLPVVIAAVDARDVGRDLLVDFSTASEVDNLGFDVLVADEDGELVTVTDEIIPAVAPTSLDGADYSVRVRADATEIWLEDTALDGTTERHGPYEVGKGYGARPDRAGPDWAEARAAVEAADPADGPGKGRGRAKGQADAAGTVARLSVDEAGLQAVTFEDLLAAGVDLGGVAARDLAVVLDGTPVDAIVDGPAKVGSGTVVRFWGEPADTIYTGTNVYHLAVDGSLAARAETAPGRATGRAQPATTHTATEVVERQRQYSTGAPGDDPWSDQTLFSLYGRPGTARVPVELGDDAGGPAQVVVDLWGVSDLPGTSRQVSVAVNGTPVGATTFSGRQLAAVQADVPAGVLVDGANEVAVTLTGIGGPVDLVALDAVTVTHERVSDAGEGTVVLDAAGAAVAVADAGKGATVLRLDGSDVTVLRNPATSRSGDVTFRGTGSAATYAVVPAGGEVLPGVERARAPVDLLDGSADYLVVGHAALLDGVAPLVAHHQAQGRTVKVVDVADVYEAYSHGNVDAQAIDDYLAEAIPGLGARWVLLVGGDTYDYRDFEGKGAFSLVPSPYGATGPQITHAPIDPAYADVEGDGVPDAALGRLPAFTPAELAVQVDKVLAYATAGHAGTAVLASDAADSADYAAVGDSLEGLLVGWDVTRADIDRLGVDGARAALLGGLADGAALTAYVGHTSPGQWSDDALLTSADAAALSGAPTVALQFGCWNTYYVKPGGLSDALLGNPAGGAAAVLGGTTLTDAATDLAFAELVVAQVASSGLTLGEAVTAAKAELATTHPGAVDVQYGWTLLGDPAMAAGSVAP